MFTLAHLSDPHIGPLPDMALSDLMSKRFFGYRNWKRNRHKVHDTHILGLTLKDLKSRKIDHVALTGDLVNISLPMEFLRARKWLEECGSPEKISVVPGNHDAYVPINWQQSLGLWKDYMASNKKGARFSPENTAFPYIRIFDHIALVGLNSGAVFPPLIARGKLGEVQIKHAEEILDNLHKQGYYRIIMIHHPPLPGQNIWRKALKERNAFKDLLERVGAELILHGHNHQDMYHCLDTQTGPAHIFGVPSASASGFGKKPAAGYHIYRLQKIESAWTLQVTKRAFNLQKGEYETAAELQY